MQSICRRFEFDTGHRVYGHQGKCRYPHGHRYALEVSLTAPELDELGMVIDFGEVKRRVQSFVDAIDHGFLVYERDTELVTALMDNLTDAKVIVLTFNPTAENLADWFATELQGVFADLDPLRLHRVRLYETPNCWADVKVPSPRQD